MSGVKSMNLYEESYLSDAQDHLGEMFDYAILDAKEDIDSFWKTFSGSSLAKELFYANPKYLAGMSGQELYSSLKYETEGIYDAGTATPRYDRSRYYWAGWSLAYYQWKRMVSYEHMELSGITLSNVVDMYILHEADVEVFVDRIDGIIASSREAQILKRLRLYAGMTQKQLSDTSNVTLRMIQLYEQGQNDISKAGSEVVNNLAHAIGCDIEDLII